MTVRWSAIGLEALEVGSLLRDLLWIVVPPDSLDAATADLVNVDDVKPDDAVGHQRHRAEGASCRPSIEYSTTTKVVMPHAFRTVVSSWAIAWSRVR